MKKLLLFAISATLMINTNAQLPTQPVKYAGTGTSFKSMSPNGRYIVGENMSTTGVEILDIVTNASVSLAPETEDENYTLGMGSNAVSNDGVFVMSKTYNGTASYVENGEIKSLPVPEGTTAAFSNAITPDGSRIAGSIGTTMTTDDIIMQRPVVWNRNADGTYSAPVELPHPSLDLTGRVPQYLLIDGISADGKILAGQMVDYFGAVCTPFVIVEDAKGEWSYKLIGLDYYNQAGVELPADPGECPAMADFLTGEGKAAYEAAVEASKNLVQPQPTDFMTDDQKGAYEAALAFDPFVYVYDYLSPEAAEAYELAINDYYNKLYPSAEDYMTEEEMAKYNEVSEAWNEAFDVYTTAYYEVLAGTVLFSYNIFTISQNGKYLVIGGSTDGMETYKPYVFDIETGKCTEKEAIPGYVLPNYVTNDGAVLACTQEGRVFIAPSLDADLVELHEYARANNSELYAWLEANTKGIEYVWDDETEEDVPVEVWKPGVPTCNADMSLILTYAEDWDLEMPIYSYVIPIGNISSVKSLNGEVLAAKMEADGIIRINGKASAVNVYDMGGKLVFSQRNPGSAVKTNLGRGAYIVKVYNDSKKAVVKSLK